MLASSLASKVTSTMAMAKVGRRAAGIFLYGLSSRGITLPPQDVGPAVSSLGSWLETLNVAGILQGSSDAIAEAASSVKGFVLVSKASLDTAASSLGPWLEMLNVGDIVQGSFDGIAWPASSVKTQAAIGVVGGGLAVAAVPMVLGALGFTTTGITGSSLAAKMMSITAIANGGGVPAGSLVSTLQSVGAAGLSTSSNVILGSVGSVTSFLTARASGF
ncbi:interferon alpha-inducible protein 27-like protein 2B isoform X2 [Octodon degus]|uniref:Interferon alpha-inducible protein 27-like protein 2B isoform X2 n=1 Tax=Octodon degus TaxID=10160 RepID=A0A6P6ESY8_OCTDE|nr:interferon alpha-inducible protein 27-like protein 2B isoform X2 [Octodon degus]